MKFGDKLIKLRKKNGLSQEELAAKLNVSRQSVSKWESNNTYPETDKIVQLCNIFDCSMDDLINENVKEIETTEGKNKKQLNNTLNSFLDFVTKTTNMFYNMTFLSGAKCIIELIFVTLVLILIGVIANGIIELVVGNVISFLPYTVINIVESIIKGIFGLVWAIITIIIVIHIFKIRYLDIYTKVANDKKSSDKDNINSKKDNNAEDENYEEQPKQKISLKNNSPRIVIRDREPFAFLNPLAKAVLWVIKTIAFFFGLFIAFILLLGIIGLILSISMTAYSNIFLGIDISFIGILIATILLLILIIHFIFGTKPNKKIAIITFFASIIVTGVGIGISLLALKDMEFTNDSNSFMETTIHEKHVKYKDNLVIVDLVPRTYEYIIDNSLANEDIVVKNNFDARFNELHYHETKLYRMPVYIFGLVDRPNFKYMYNIIISDLKNNIIRDYYNYSNEEDIKIVASSETVEKLIANFSKIYTYDIETTSTGYLLSNISSRIIEGYGTCNGEYNALTGEIESFDSCKCIKEVNKDTGEIEYSCYDKNDENNEDYE